MARAKKKIDAKAAEAAANEIKFGTDGWRGVMARDFTFDNVRRVAQAVAEHLKNQGRKSSPVVIGYDRRFQGDSFAREIARILAANGIKTTLSADPLPTPAITFLSHKLKALGVMVTASHNPPSFNGIKLKTEGRAANEGLTAEIESCLDRSNPMRNGGAKVPEKSFRKDYLSYLKARGNPGKFMGQLKRPVVVDYMHGASGGLLGEMLKSKKIIEIRAERDPLFGGVNPEPIEKNLAALKERVLKEKAVLGIALDGDGDRVAIVDDKGRYLSPCQVFPILLEYLITMRKIKGKIVQSVSMGYLGEKVAKEYGLEFEQLPVGFKHVGEAIARGEAAMGGEESGGYAWKGNLPERDGLLTGLIFIEMCVKTKKTPSQLWELIEKKYGKSDFRRVDFRINKPVDKTAFTTKIRKRLPKKVAGNPILDVMDFDGVKVFIEGGHWVLMRPSGTEPLIRTYAETDSPKKTQALLETAARWVGSHL
jgi:phosphomannomutase